MTEIISKVRKYGNNASKTDTIGSEVGSIPPFIFKLIINIPEFDWIFESNENMCLFLKKNPQFWGTERIKFSASGYDMPRYIINRDDTKFDIPTLDFKSSKNKGRWCGK